VIWNAEFDMLAPGRMESSITVDIRERYEQLFGQEKSVDQYRGSKSWSVPESQNDQYDKDQQHNLKQRESPEVLGMFRPRDPCQLLCYRMWPLYPSPHQAQRKSAQPYHEQSNGEQDEEHLHGVFP
jgi:hypothetical protein